MTEPTIPELADQVRAGLDADEAATKKARPGPWMAGGEREHLVDTVVYGQSVWPPDRLSHVCDTEYAGQYAVANAEHIARHDPERVLAEVASKRALLDLVLGWPHGKDEHGNECLADVLPEHPCDCGLDERVRAVLTLLAQPYQEANHG